MKQDSKKRLLEVMTRLDKNFKPQLNEEFGADTNDPTKEEMVGFLTNEFQSMDSENIDFDVAAAIYWFGNDYHGGQNSNLYSALSTSEFRPGPMHKGIEDEESETATLMYQELVNKYGGGAQEDSIDAGNTQWHGIEMNEDPIGEVFGWSGKEKEAKANTETINNAKAEITKYPPSHIWGQPGRNSAPADDKQLMTVRLNMAKQHMPTLAELMPQLFDLTQGYGDMVQIYNGKPLKGLIPSNWYYFLRGEEGYVDNEQAVRKLNQEIDNLGQQIGLQEDDKWIQKAVDPAHKGYCTPMTKDTCTPRRKALAKRFKADDLEENISIDVKVGDTIMTGRFKNSPTLVKSIGKDEHGMPTINGKKVVTFKKGVAKDESVTEAIVGDNPEEYRSKVEKIKQTMDKLFNDEYFDIIDTLYRLLVTRGKGAGQIGALTENADAISTGHNIYKDVMILINHQAGDEIWGGGAESALKFYENVLEGLRDALYQDLADSVNPNAGAAPDEIQ